MTTPHIFVESNFLINIFQMPSRRTADALALQKRFAAGEIKLYIPYVCFQEARHKIGVELPKSRFGDLLAFDGFAASCGMSTWDSGAIRKLVDAATAEQARTRAVYQRELKDFSVMLGDGVLHGTREVFDFLESLELDGDGLKYNDKLILSSVFVKAKALHDSGERLVFFASLDKSDLRPDAAKRPKMTRYYADAGLIFVPGFVIPDAAAPAS